MANPTGDNVTGQPPTHLPLDDKFPKLLANPSLLQIVTDVAHTVGQTYQQLLSGLVDQFNACSADVEACYVQVWHYLANRVGLQGNDINAMFNVMAQDIAGQVATGTSGFSPIQHDCLTEIDKICTSLNRGEFAILNNIMPTKPANWNYPFSFESWIGLATPLYVRDSACAMAAGVYVNANFQLIAFNGISYDPHNYNPSQVQSELTDAAGTEEYKPGMPATRFYVIDCNKDNPFEDSPGVLPINPTTGTGVPPTVIPPTVQPPTTGQGPTTGATPPIQSTGPPSEVSIPPTTTPDIPCPTQPPTIQVMPAPVTVINQQVQGTTGGASVADCEAIEEVTGVFKLGDLVKQYLCVVGFNAKFVEFFGDVVDEELEVFLDDLEQLPADFLSELSK